MSEKTQNSTGKKRRIKRNDFHRRTAQLMIEIQDEVHALEAELEVMPAVEHAILIRMISLETITCLKRFAAKIP